jgi:hypothetical protein
MADNENIKNIKNIKKCEYMKKYNEENKMKLNEKFICNICGGKYQKMNTSHHYKTKKHQDGVIIQNLIKENEKFKVDN